MRNSRMKSSMFSLLGAMLLADGMNMREATIYQLPQSISKDFRITALKEPP